MHQNGHKYGPNNVGKSSFRIDIRNSFPKLNLNPKLHKNIFFSLDLFMNLFGIMSIYSISTFSTKCHDDFLLQNALGKLQKSSYTNSQAIRRGWGWVSKSRAIKEKITFLKTKRKVRWPLIKDLISRRTFLWLPFPLSPI